MKDRARAAAPSARTRARRRAFRLGRWAERLCAWRLRLVGYRVLARRYRTPVGELDLVVRRGRTLAFVEVKARPTLAGAAEAIDRRQRARVERAAAAFLAHHPALAGLEMRFDAMLVAPRRWPRHLADAWRT